jgi:hypothetical protein
MAQTSTTGDPAFDAWLRARRWEPGQLHPNETKLLRAMYEYETQPGGQPRTPQPDPRGLDLRSKEAASAP